MPNAPCDPSATQPITATEILKREAEAPPSKIGHSVLEPIIQRTYDILRRHGLVD